MRGPWDAATAPRAAGSCSSRLRRAPRGGCQLLSAEQPARGAGRRVWCAEGAGCGSPAAAGGPGSSAYPSSRLIASPSPAAGTGRQAAGQTCQPAAGSRAPAPRSQEGPGWGCRLGRTRTRPSPVLRGREPPAAAASPRGSDRRRPLEHRWQRPGEGERGGAMAEGGEGEDEIQFLRTVSGGLPLPPPRWRGAGGRGREG